MPGTVYLTDERLQLSRGLVRDAEPRNIFGFNSAIGTSFIAAWENNVAYVYPNTALTMTAVSDSASDTAVTIRVIGLDANYDVIATNTTLNGTSSVTLSIPFFRINDVITISGNAVGNVTIANGGTTYAKINAGTGKNQASIFTVSAGYEFYLYRIDAFCASAAQNNRIVFFRNFVGQSNGTVLQVAQTSFLETMNIQRRIPFRYAEKSDIQLQVRGSGGSQEIGVFAEGILAKVPRTSALTG
jgi:hypothetical protein